MWTPGLRTVGLHAVSAGAGAIAMIGFASQHAVDLYAIWNQMNVVVAEIGKLLAMLTPVASAAYALYKSTAKQKLIDLSTTPQFKGAVVAPELAAIVPSGKVVSSVEALPVPAQNAT